MLSEAIRQAIVQMAGSGMSVESILETLERRGIETTMEEVVSVILEAGRESEDGPADLEDGTAVLKWLIREQMERVRKLRSVEKLSPLPLAETTQNIKLLADLVIKHIELTSGTRLDVAKLKERMLFG